MAKVKVNIPTVKLNNGLELPALGYGTWVGLNSKMEFLYSEIPKLKEAMAYAIDVGYRHIDTAHLYRVEPEVGEIIHQKIKEKVVTREELFVTTKVWHHMHRPADVEVSVRDSLRRMKLDYLDCVLMHWPMAISVDGDDEKIDYVESWKGFEAVLKKGLVKSIGVSNFNVEQLKRLLANSTVKPVTNQVEIHLTLGEPELVEYCQSQGIVVVAYAPFGALVPSKATAGTPGPRIDDPTLVGIAKKYNKTVTQITLRYLFQRGLVSIPKTSTKARVVENASIFDFALTDDEFKTMAKFDVNYRVIRLLFWEPYTYFPFEKTGEVTETHKIPQSLLQWKNGVNNDID